MENEEREFDGLINTMYLIDTDTCRLFRLGVGRKAGVFSSNLVMPLM